MKVLTEKQIEDRLRRKAKKLGYIIRKSRLTSSNYNVGYMIINYTTNVIEAGEGFTFSLDEVEKFLMEDDK